MSKEELRDKVEALSVTILKNEKYDIEEILVNQSKVLELIDQLDEPEITYIQAVKHIASKHDVNAMWLGTMVETLIQYSGTDFTVIHLKELLKTEKQVVPHYVFDWIKRQRTYDYEDVLYALNRALLNSDDKVKKWVNKYKDEFCRAWVFYPLIEIDKNKVYRFEQEAFMEQDYLAKSLEEAKEAAKKEWRKMFQEHGLFGQPNYKGVVDDEGNVIEE